MAKSRKKSSARAASKATADTTAVEPGTDGPDDLSPDSADPATGDDASDRASAKDPVTTTKRTGKDPVSSTGEDEGKGPSSGSGSKSSAKKSGKAASGAGVPGNEVTEKAKDATRAGSPKKAAAAESARTKGRRVAAEAPNPAWLAPTAVVLLLVGLAYLVTFYLSAGALPLPIGDWNLAAGFGVMLVGGGMLMFWK